MATMIRPQARPLGLPVVSGLAMNLALPHGRIMILKEWAVDDSADVNMRNQRKRFLPGRNLPGRGRGVCFDPVVRDVHEDVERPIRIGVYLQVARG